MNSGTEEITNRDDYLAKFRGDPAIPNPTMQAEALKYAHEIRKLEIDLYWRRAAYFWTFIAAAFGAFFLLERTGNSPTASQFLVACVGLVFSVAWSLANRGSKYWQDNWEQHVDLLENEITGPLYKMNAGKPDGVSRWSLLEAYPFSVSRINQVLSLFVIAIWGILVLVTASAAFSIGSLLVVTATVAGLWALLYKTKTRRTGEGREFPIKMQLRKRGE
ncbi:MAG: RipA family octameric membrane protein [Sulfuricella sp.]